MEKRSVGIRILGIFLILSALSVPISLLVTGIIIQKRTGFTLFESLSLMESALAKYQMSVLFNFVLWLIPLGAILWLISGIGILRLKNWARKIIIYWAIVSIFLKLIWLIFYPRIGHLSAIIFSAFLIYFFTRPKVKEQFG